MAHVLSAPLGGTPKVILLGLANHADAQFGNARPAVGTLAEYANCDRRTVQRTLRKLEADGWIAKTGDHPVAGRADRSVSVWRITRRQIATPQANGAALVGERGGTGVANGAAPMPPEPSIEPSIEPVVSGAREATPLTDVFDALTAAGFDRWSVEQSQGAIGQTVAEFAPPADVDWWRVGQDIKRLREDGTIRARTPAAALRFICKGVTGLPRKGQGTALTAARRAAQQSPEDIARRARYDEGTIVDRSASNA